MDLKEHDYLYRVRCNELMNAKKPNESIYDIYNYYENYIFFKDIFDTETSFNAFIKDKRNRKNRRYRTHKKMLSIINLSNKYTDTNKLVFGTLTFNEKEMKNEERTRTKKIDKYIKEHCLIALVNIDYGKTTEREHHHFIGILKPNEELIKTKRSHKGIPQYKLLGDKEILGWNTYEIIDLKDTKRLVNYLLKIENHSNKKTTRNRRIRFIYNKKDFGII